MACARVGGAHRECLLPEEGTWFLQGPYTDGRGTYEQEETVGKRVRGGSVHKLLAVACSLALCISFCLPSAQAIAATAAAAGQDEAGAAEQQAQSAAGTDEQDTAATDTQQEATQDAAETADEAAEAQAAQAAQSTKAQVAEVAQPQANNSATIAASTVWDGTTVDTSWYNTTDTEFTISTAAQLAGLAAITSPKNDYAAWQAGTHDSRADGIAQDNFAGKTVKLGADIDLGDKQFDPISDFNNWGGGGQGTSDGTYDGVGWQGTFDGAGHTISNLSVDGSINCSTNYNGNQGLIAAIGAGGVVKTLGVSGWVKARVGGGIVGCSSVSAEDTATLSKDQWPTIMNCWAKVDIEGNGTSKRGCGGIFGGEGDYRSACNIINCYAKGDATNSIGQAAGVAAIANGAVAGCYNLGDASGSKDAAIVSQLYMPGSSKDSFKGTGIYSNNMALQNTSDAGNSWRSQEAASGEPTAHTDGFYTSAEIKAGAATLGSAYVEDTNNINAGFPILFWQAGLSTLDISGATIAAIANQTFTTEAIEPKLTVTLDGATLNEGSDYYVVYSDNVKPGTASAKVYGTGRYTGQIAEAATFTIEGTDISECTITPDPISNAWSYGETEPATPSVTVKSPSGATLTKDTDYELVYENNVETGKGTVTVKGLGNGVAGSLSKDFYVVRASDSVEGSGTDEDPYLVASKADFQFVSHQIKNGNTDYINGSIKVTADLDLTAADEKDLAADSLGYYGYPAPGVYTTVKYLYNGNFDGGSHEIKLGGQSPVGTWSYVSALIAWAGVYNESALDGQTQTIKNVVVTGEVSSTGGAAGIVGRGMGTTQAFENCVNKAKVSGAGNVGGIAGQVMSASFADCHNTGEISNTGNISGGILAYPNDQKNLTTATLSIKDCSNSASVTSARTTGGIIGQGAPIGSPISVERCWNTGDVSATGGYYAAAGIVGSANYSNAYAALTVKACYNTGTVTSVRSAGGVVGGLGYGNSTIENCYNTGAVSTTMDTSDESNYGTGGLVGTDIVVNSATATRTVNISGYNVGEVSSLKGDHLGQLVGNIRVGYANSWSGATTAAKYPTTWNISASYIPTTGCAASVGVYSKLAGDNEKSVLNDTSTGYDEATLKGLTSTTLDQDEATGFLKDEPAPEINGGYPVLYWQRVAFTVDDIADQIWTAPVVMAQPVVKVGDKTLVKDLDYTLTYTNNDEVGTATVTITPAGAYAGRAAAVDKEFTIVAQNLSGATIGAIEEQLFEGSPVTPEPVITDADGVELVKGVDYDLSYKNNDKAGTGTVVVTGKGNYTGTKEATFTIKSNSAGAGAWKRLWGNTAFGTMKQIVNEGWTSGSKYAIVATSSGYYDALSASGLAGLLDCPILMTAPDKLSDATSALIKSKGVKNVIVVGGTSAVSANTFNQIEKLGVSVKRVWGNTAIGTANKIYAYGNTLLKNGTIKEGWSKDAIVATSSSYQDALSIAPYAYQKKAPIFLTKGKPGTLIDTSVKAIKNGGFERTIITGGTAAVAKSVESQVTTAKKERLWGNTAYGTSRKIADFCIKDGKMTTAHMGVATGRSYYDALAGAALCGKMNSVLVLADDGNSNTVDNVVKVYKDQLQKNCYVFGGKAAVSETVYNKVLTASK